MQKHWQQDTPNMYGDTSNGMGYENIAPAGVSIFPREYVVAMAENWLNDPVNGFYSKVPLTRTALKDWGTHNPGPFAVVPDGNWFMLRSLYMHNVDALANKFTLGHLKKYNMAWGEIPVAPEARDDAFELFGDQYSNFNAGKILLLLEGIGGLSYSVSDDTFTFADSLPKNWTFMEFRVPVVKDADAGAPTWVTARSERACQSGGKVVKTVTVISNPFKTLNLRPWAEDGTVVSSSPPHGSANQSAGHVDWSVNASSATAVLTLETQCNPTQWY